MYTNCADPMLAFRFTLVGLVSRIVESIMQENMPSEYYGQPRQSKNQIVVFIMSVLVYDGRQKGQSFRDGHEGRQQ